MRLVFLQASRWSMSFDPFRPCFLRFHIFLYISFADSNQKDVCVYASMCIYGYTCTHSHTQICAPFALLQHTFFPDSKTAFFCLYATVQAIELIPLHEVQERPVNIFLIRGYSGPLDNQPPIVKTF